MPQEHSPRVSEGLLQLNLNVHETTLQFIDLLLELLLKWSEVNPLMDLLSLLVLNLPVGLLLLLSVHLDEDDGLLFGIPLSHLHLLNAELLDLSLLSVLDLDVGLEFGH